MYTPTERRRIKYLRTNIPAIDAAGLMQLFKTAAHVLYCSDHPPSDVVVSEATLDDFEDEARRRGLISW